MKIDNVLKEISDNLNRLYFTSIFTNRKNTDRVIFDQEFKSKNMHTALMLTINHSKTRFMVMLLENN